MIYIKDMEMPVDCLACRISCKHESYLVTGRPKDCPLEEAKTGGLISRADAIEAVRKELVCDGRHEAHDKTCRFIADVLLSALPSAEAVQGEWIRTVGGNGWNEWYVIKCPICGATIEDKHYHSWKYNFCPNCGAKMKGGDDE